MPPGTDIALAPNPALAIYRRQRHFLTLVTRPKLTRQLAAVTRGGKGRAPHVEEFIDHLVHRK